MSEQWFSAEDLAKLGQRGLRMPTSARGCRNVVQREQWPSRTVQGKGGKGGLKTVYQPPTSVMAAIAALGGGAQPEARDDAPYSLAGNSTAMATGDGEASRFRLEHDAGALIARKPVSVEGTGGLQAHTLSTSVSLVMKIQRVMKDATWLPPDIDDANSDALVMRASQRLLLEAGFAEDQLARLVQFGDVIDGALRFEWALMRLGSD